MPTWMPTPRAPGCARPVPATWSTATPTGPPTVGVAGLVDDGRVVVGCNVENAAYGVALCAECGMVSQLHATGGGRLVAVSCVGGDGEPLMACGRCRQLLWENGGPACLVLTPEGILPMSAILPQAFGPDDLDAAASRRASDAVLD